VHAVGIIANPASGRDIRRLVAGASVFGNPEKAGMVFRVLAGLGAAGVERALMMPAADGLGSTLDRLMLSHGEPLPLEVLDMPITGTADDTTTAVRLMLAAGVKAIVVLGGDGTHRVVAKACGDTPICALSTGTNNAFPEMREATVAGLATGLYDGEAIREPALEVRVDGAAPDLALVDVAVSPRRFVGARALWRADSVSEIFVTHADPGAVGLSAIAGRLAPGARGVHVTLGPGETLTVPIAPGLLVPVEVASYAIMDGAVALAPAAGCLALDGEREIERRAQGGSVRLVDGPLRIDVDAVMRRVATRSQRVQE
jgi:predicted polyphosphate/ATP-dependent NAD kinase